MLFSRVVGAELHSVWFTRRGSRRALGVSDVLAKQGLARGGRGGEVDSPALLLLTFNHEWLSAECSVFCCCCIRLSGFTA